MNDNTFLILVVHGDRGITNPEISTKIAKPPKGFSLPELPVSPDLDNSTATTSFSTSKAELKVKKEIQDEEVQILAIPSKRLTVSLVFISFCYNLFILDINFGPSSRSS